MTDLVVRLKQWAVSSNGWADTQLTEVLKEAITEIEHLRSVARSVTWGAGDYRTITKDARHDLCGNE